MREWPLGMDVEQLLADGWRPTPFRQFVLKVHSRCDLACDYCYVYEMADSGWRSQPVRMSRETVLLAARRVAEHVRTHRTPQIEIILHGGEPLLAGPATIRQIVTIFQEELGNEVDVRFTVQTNGTLLNDRFLRVFRETGTRVGISLDGDARMHDRSRRRANGRGSHSLVMAALRRLTAPTYRDLFAGLICTVDLRNDPVAAYEALLQPAPPAIDFLLPLGNWSAPPPGRTDDPAATPYADWLIPIFDRWYHAPSRPTRVRLFDEILRLLLGGQSGTEQIGLSPAAMIVIETDGSLNQSDLLKSAYENATATGLHLTSDSLDTALLLPGFAARQIGPRALAPACRSCPVARVCGGGLYAHRYRAGRGFANPSVYCPDLLALITHIKQTVEADLRHRLTSPKGQRPCT